MMIRSRTRRRRGLAMVESTFGLVIILFVTFGIIEYGQLIMARQLLANAAWDAANAASKGVQPATYDDGTPTPSPNGPVTTAYLNVVVAKAMAPAPLTGITSQFYGSNANGTVNTSIPWSSAGFGQGIFVTIQGTYVPLFSGNRLYTSAGNTGPMVGSITMSTTHFIRAEANN